MVPWPSGPGPARSRSCGSSEKTLGVYPLEAGGSPADRLISRWAMAKRVTLSIRHSTSAPWLRKYSATVTMV